MARLTKEQRLQDVHEEAKTRFAIIQSSQHAERMQCLQDRRFYSIAGAQWEGSLQTQFANKPQFEVNKVALAIQRIFTEYRNNRISVSFTSKHGDKADQLADICAGLYRADEQDSCAEEAYDNAFEEAVGGGFGAWELRPEYEDDEDPDNEQQRIRFVPIFDADSSVFFNLDAKRQDKSDAKYCFVLTSMTPDAYEEAYGDNPSSWPKTVSQTEFDWATSDVVYVARYYCIEEVNRQLVTFEAIDGSEFKLFEDEITDDMRQEMDATGTIEIRRRRVKSKKVHLYTMSGGSILEDHGYIAGKHIPVIPVFGKRWYIDNIERCSGHVRNAKDAQRLKNMQLSKLGEISSLSSYRKPILTPEQVAGHQETWATDNIKNYPYLLLNPIVGPDGSVQPQGPIGYVEPPDIPPTLAALLQVSEQDIRDLLGNQEQGDKVVSNISGKVIEMVQQRLDMQSFLYLSNMAKAVRRCGEVWLHMAREIYVEPDRKMKAISAQNDVSMVELQRNVLNNQGVPVVENDLTNAHLDVVVDVGPSFTSQRAAIVRTITNMMAITTDPETQKILQSIALMNMEGEGLRDARVFFRKQLVQMGVIKPTEDEMAEMEAAASQAQTDPNAIILQAEAQEAMAKAADAQAKIDKTMADTELARARAIDLAAKIEQADRDQLLRLVQILLAEKGVQAPPLQDLVGNVAREVTQQVIEPRVAAPVEPLFAARDTPATAPPGI